MKKEQKIKEAIATLQLIARTERAIDGTYGPKQQTKFRRQLPGKRKWKNKEAQYSKLKTQMLVKKFNARSVLRSAL